MKQTDERSPLDQSDEALAVNYNGTAADFRKKRRGTIGLRATRHGLHDEHAGEFKEQARVVKFTQRLRSVERESRRLTYSLLIIAPLLFYTFVDRAFSDFLVTKESLVALDRMQLFDEQGNVRMYMRVYSGVPLVQLIDESGTPRLSLGLRYDDSPFISLSDVGGKTRASLQMGADDQPELKLFDENGKASFSAQ